MCCGYAGCYIFFCVSTVYLFGLSADSIRECFNYIVLSIVPVSVIGLLQLAGDWT